MKRLAIFPILFVALAPHVAFAADPPKNGTDPAAAESLFFAARTLMNDGKFAEACPKLEESLRLDPGLGTQFNLADCNEHIGKITTAWAGFLEVAALAKTANQADRDKLARKRAAALEPRLPKLVIEVTAAAPGLEIRRDGIAIGSAAWGTAIPVDPGAHRIVASAPGKQPFETMVAAYEGKVARVAVPGDLASAPDAAPVANGGAAAFPSPIVEKRGATQRTVGWLVLGLGAVGVGVGAGFGFTSLGKRNESRSHCTGDVCDDTGRSLRDDAIRAGNVSTVAMIGGGAAALGGILLVLTAPKTVESPPETGKLRATPTAMMGGGGFTLQGSFQ